MKITQGSSHQRRRPAAVTAHKAGNGAADYPFPLGDGGATERRGAQGISRM